MSNLTRSDDLAEVLDPGDWIDPAPLQPVQKLDRDVRKAVNAAAPTMTQHEVRELVDLYYRLQKDRVSLGNQRFALEAGDRPAEVVSHFAGSFVDLEAQMKGVLLAYVQGDPVGRWLLGIKGIGPVLAAGMLAHIDITRAPTAGHIWRFAGLDPTVKWAKGEKRPWNARLKKTCWLIGDSFVKSSGREVGPGEINYGVIYRARKTVELERNAAGAYADQAAAALRDRKITDKALKATYEAGQLPLGRIELRARRYAVKLFLSHLHYVMHVQQYGEAPPKPYALTAAGGHAHFIAPPSYTREA